jgi:hypothetical protein
MKGYPVSNGYMGLICGEYLLFPTEEEYVEMYKELEGEK